MQWEFAVLNFIAENLRTEFLNSFMAFVTSLGEAGMIWIITAIILITVKPFRKIGLAMLVALFIMQITGNMLLKPWVGRKRPFQVCPGAPVVISPPGGYSFPSGHTYSSFAAATVLFLGNKRLGIPAVLLAAMIGFSRLYLYVHFPTDVLAGMILGILVGSMAWKWVNSATLPGKYWG